MASDVGKGRILAHWSCDILMHLARCPLLTREATLTGFETDFGISRSCAISIQPCANQRINRTWSESTPCRISANKRSSTVRFCPKIVGWQSVAVKSDGPLARAWNCSRLGRDREGRPSRARVTRSEREFAAQTRKNPASPMITGRAELGSIRARIKT